MLVLFFFVGGGGHAVGWVALLNLYSFALLIQSKTSLQRMSFGGLVGEGRQKIPSDLVAEVQELEKKKVFYRKLRMFRVVGPILGTAQDQK